MKKNSPLEQIHMQIMWNRLISVVEEQAQTLMRTAFSPTVREAGDLSAGVFDLSGRMLAQAVTGTPGHVNAMAASVGFFLEKFPIESMSEGDVYITNDPWKGTGHLLDFTLVTPTFRDGKPVALFASTSHVVDVGGVGFGADGRQVYEEGIRIPIMALAKKGEINRSLIEIVKTNVREPIQVEGDLYSLAACNETGSDRLLAMMKEFDLERVDELADYVIANSHQAMLEEIRRLPFGTYRNAMRIDGYEKPLDLVAALTIGEDGIDLDFTGTSPVSTYGINVPLTYTQAYGSFGVRCIVGGTVPNNAGSLAPVRVSCATGLYLERAGTLRGHRSPRDRPDAAGCGSGLPAPGPAGRRAGGGHLLPVEPGAAGRPWLGRRVRLRRCHSLRRQHLSYRRHRGADHQGWPQCHLLSFRRAQHTGGDQ